MTLAPDLDAMGEAARSVVARIAAERPAELRGEPVRWAKLSVAEVARVVDDLGRQRYEVLLAGAAPDAWPLLERVWRELRARGWQVAVRSEW